MAEAPLPTGGDGIATPGAMRIALFLATAALACAAVAPLVWMVSMAFKGPAEVFSMSVVPARPTLGNFVYVLTEVAFLRYLLNTLLVAGTVTVAALWFHSMAGYALARLRFPGREAIFVAMSATVLISRLSSSCRCSSSRASSACSTATPV
ncbi:MAG TPA: hypothetical protein VFY87_20695 [Geminicoccaceae bacterium]|nr:hypothetical protein [Geminicoccaceae bacterium]